ncbi:N-acyl-D-amino-acid deacylase family protein [Pelagerythrobacter aerophilus]|uniref:D-aminoacylase n=1 Tax=Pelagerythrobacter aerophilus TaxID=2306995 RepID=A0A418NGH1_9SPHN|nr:amidohydrolase family protein [Pelagerythrobacter aerophilus]RIV77159.1 D-aminoacylase [Pelagerythrobacter aerophilus]
MISIRAAAFIAATAFSVSVSATAGNTAPGTVDLLIRGGTVYDGSDSPPFVGDVAITGDRIVAVGPSLDVAAAKVQDAHGMIVSPGFIDAHTHPDSYIRSDDPTDRLNLPWLAQGVSTIVIGVDGSGSFNVANDLATLEASGIGTNVAALVGFATIRTKVIGEVDRTPTPAELKEERALVAKAMCEGAYGFSTGLFYAPQSYSQTDEVVMLAKEAAARGGIYDTHQRDESSYTIGLVSSVDEAIEIGRRAGLPVHFAHLKALGVDVHGQSAAVIERIERARADGIEVTADQYPWTASGSNLQAALVPRWAVDGGYDAMLERFGDSAALSRIKAEMEENLRRRGGKESLLLTATDLPWTGKTLGQMADQWHVSPVDAAIRILSSDVEFDESRNEGSLGRSQLARTASFNMSDGDVEAFMKQPWVVTGSDGSDGHPRQYASFPRKYETYVKERAVLSLGDFIHRSTGATADIYGMAERGYLRPGYFADVLVFDPDEYAPRADYTNPRMPSVGVRSLVVNGTEVLRDGKPTGTAAGRAMRHVPPEGSCS